MHRVLLVLGAAVLLSGCSLDAWFGPPTAAQVEGLGTVQFVDLEGGFYGLVADDGARYLPLNLAEAFRQDGLRVRFRARIVQDVATIQQWGTPVELLSIARAE